MTVHEAILKELMVAGYEGAPLLAAFGRLCTTLAEHGMATPAVAAPAHSVERRSPRKAPAVDRRQLNMMLASDGGQAKAPPMSAAERQAKRRANRQHSVTLVTSQHPQAIDFIEESRNVTKNRDSYGQVVDSVDETDVPPRGSVTRRRKKEVPPHPLKKKHLPQIPPGDEIVTLSFDDPLIPVLEEMAGKRFPRFGQGRSVKRKLIDAARSLLAERAADPPQRLKAG